MSFARGARTSVLVFGILGLFSAIAPAQSTQGLITGRVFDQATGRPIAQIATVRCQKLPDGASGQALADGEGFYVLPLLSPGTYRLRATAGKDYQPREYQDIRLAVAAELRVDFELRPITDVFDQRLAGGVYFPESRALLDFYGPDVDSGRALLLDPLNAREGRLESTVSEVIDPAKIEMLPLAGRDVYNALALLPGVAADTATVRGIGLSANGQRPSASNFLLDGVENNNYLITGPLAGAPPEAIQEYRVSISSFSAEYGGAAGYVANAVTRAAGRQWHGLAYANLKNESLDANDFARNAKGDGRARDREIQPGAYAGGPVILDRLFASAAFDWRSSHGTEPAVRYYLPSTQFLSDIKSFPADRTARRLLTEFPPPPLVSPTGDQAAPTSTAPPVSVDRMMSLDRIDAPFRGGRDRLLGRVAVSRLSRPDFGWSPYAGFSTPFDEDTTSVMIGEQSALTARLSLETRARLGADRVQFDRPHPEIPSIMAGRDNSTDMVWLPGSLLAYSYRNHSRNLEWNGSLFRTGRRHAWKAGGGFLRRTLDGYLTYGRDGELSFPNFTAFQADRPSSVLVGLSREALATGEHALPNYDREYRYTQFYLYAQDSFRVNSRLTWNYGLRYENFGAPANTGVNKDPVVAMGTGQDFTARLAGASLRFPGAGDQRLYDGDNNNFGARWGMAVDPFGRGNTFLRAGYGIFYDRPFDNLWQNVAANAFVPTSFPLSGSVDYSGGIAQLARTLPNALIYRNSSSLTLMQPGLRDAYTQSYFAGVQHRAAEHLTLEWNALGASGRKLVTTDIVNRVSSRPGIVDDAPSRYSPSLPDIDYRANQGASSYAALAAVARYRSARTQIEAAYTWSHSIDNQSEPMAGKYFNFEFDQTGPLESTFTRQLDSRADRGNSDFDQRHNLVFHAIRELPAPATSRALATLLRNWRVAVVGAVRSGLPYAVLGRADSTNIMNNRADLVKPEWRSASEAPDRAGRMLLNTSAFGDAAVGQLGNTGRNAFRGPGFYNFDCSLARVFAAPGLGEKARVTLRADAYNLLNHANLGNPESYRGSPDFGLATYGRQERSPGLPAVFPLRETARQVQVLIRLEF